jgi:hypothetical protein
MFENSHQHLIDNLELDDDKLKEELSINISNESKELSDSITKKLI